MEQILVQAYMRRCIQDQVPQCTAACPIHVDGRGMMKAVAEGDFAAAGALVAKQSYFPNIVCRLCDAPCEAACKRNDVGEGLRIGDIERAASAYGAIRRTVKRPFRKTKTRIAVAGGGLAALTAAMLLYEKGHPLSLFVPESRLGGKETEAIDKAGAAGDLDVVTAASLSIEYGATLDGATLAALCDEYDALFLGDASLLEPLGLRPPATVEGIEIWQTENPKVFAIDNAGPWRIHHLSMARAAADSIDRFVKKVSLTGGREPPRFGTSLYVNLEGIEPSARVASEGDIYTQEEAAAEAGRCLQCACMECVKVCPFLEKYGEYPKLYIDDLAADADKVVGFRRDKFKTLSCAQCGLCAEVCPNELDTGDFIQKIKVDLNNNNVLPLTFHDLPVRDMLYTNSDACSFFRLPPGGTKAGYMFFPGCQLPAVLPEQTTELYKTLLGIYPNDVSLYTRCCSVPALWAGYRELFDEQVAEFRACWEQQGRPVVLYACPACCKTLSEALPEAKFLPVWQALAEAGLALPEDDGRYTLHDACNARGNAAVQASARQMLRGVDYDEFAMAGDETKCCGYGGLIPYTDREVSRTFGEVRLGETERDLAVYCAMCRDHFVARGRRAKHLVEFLFGEGEQRSYTFSERQARRAHFKTSILSEVWGEETMPQKEIPLIMADEVKALLTERMIFENDARRVISRAEEEDRRVFNPKTGRYTASERIGLVTYWVVYTPRPEGYEVHSAYSHRIEIEGTE